MGSARRFARLAAALASLAALGACATYRGDVRRDIPSIPAAQANAESLRTLDWAPFGARETGWETYLPLVAAEIGVAPIAQGTPFAQALADWQARRGLRADGVFTPETFTRMRDEVQGRRPFVRQRTEDRRTGAGCPDPPDEATLAWTTPAESWGARPNAARPGTLEAWRRMRAAAARDRALESPLSLQVFSAYRSPDHDAAACAAGAPCDGVRRATCSAHRTGLALDLVLDGVRPVDSTRPEDRLRLSRSPTYRWLLLNARRFGFVNYPFEPWHWEWTGEPVASPRPVMREIVSPPPPAPAPGPARQVEATDLLPPELSPR